MDDEDRVEAACIFDFGRYHIACHHILERSLCHGGGGREWTEEMGWTSSCIVAASAFLLLLLIGLRLRRIYDRKTCLISISIVVAYTIIFLVLERIAQHFGPYPSIFLYMLLTLEPFSSLYSPLLMSLPDTVSLLWPSIALSVLSPYVLLPFTKKQLPAEQATPAQ